MGSISGLVTNSQYQSLPVQLVLVVVTEVDNFVNTDKTIGAFYKIQTHKLLINDEENDFVTIEI